MSDTNTDLINELRVEAARWTMPWPGPVMNGLLTRAADALEAADTKVLDWAMMHAGDSDAEVDILTRRVERAEADNRRLLEERANLTSDEAIERARDAWTSEQHRQHAAHVGQGPNTITGRTENARARMRAALRAALEGEDT